MRLLSFLVAGVVLASRVLAQDIDPEVTVEKHHYQVRLQLASHVRLTAERVLRVTLPAFARS
jgi:hypothetical protein